MRRLLDRLDRGFFAEAPAERLALLRLLVGAFALVYLCVRAVHLQRVGHLPPESFRPIGVVSALSAPLPLWAVRGLVGAAIAAGAAFVAGYRFRVAGPLFSALLLWVLTYRNSWGMVFHTENLLVLHVIALSLGASADALSLDARAARRAGAAPPAPDGRYGWPIRLFCAITVASYFIAGVTKLRNSGLDWAFSDILRNYVAYDNVRKIALGDTHSPLGGALVRYRFLFPPLALASLAMELGAPLALFSRRIAVVFCGAAWLFHLGVLLTMAILFPYPLLGIAFAGFFELEKMRDLRRPRRASMGVGPSRRYAPSSGASSSGSHTT
ncbi:HTTM domain-containing protein [Sorangium sp. So ce542]|uniref:HTTM domain-containing protein n=1 Tax=Sorangium sp. So ce542 TaxID=3133316 RepID=UPI003F61812C